MNGRQKRRPTVVGVLAAGGVLATVVTVWSGFGCPDSGQGSCGPSLTPFLAGALLAAGLTGLPLLVRHMRAAPTLEQSIVVACCVAFGSGFAAVLGVLAALVGAPTVAIACVMMIAASGLLLSRHDLLVAAGLCLIAGSGGWAVAEQAAATLFLAPAMLFWLAAGLIRIGAPFEPADQAWSPSRKVRPQVARAAAVMK